jgi:hypothetical protein
LLSRISSSGAYFNERTYQISTQSGNLVFSKTPSLTGTYGQENRILHLPRIIKSTVSQENSDSNWSKHFGVISLEDGHIPWAGVGYTQGNSAIKIATYALNNIFVSYEKRNFLIANLGFEITIGTALQGKNQITLTSLQYIF